MRGLTPLAVFGLIAAAPVPRGSEGVQIIQKDRSFSKSAVTLQTGQPLIFKNEDAVTHNVFSQTPGMEFDLRTQRPGEQSTISFEHAGISEVRCAIHPTMKLIVTVKQ